MGDSLPTQASGLFASSRYPVSCSATFVQLHGVLCSAKVPTYLEMDRHHSSRYAAWAPALRALAAAGSPSAAAGLAAGLAAINNHLDCLELV